MSFTFVTLDSQQVTNRARVIPNYLITLIAFAKHMKVKSIDLIKWLHEQYDQHGYYDSWILQYGYGNFVEYTNDFVKGRQLIYDKVYLLKQEDSCIVETHTWFKDDQPETLYYLDIDLEEFIKHAGLLAKLNAQRLGVSVDISFDFTKMVERAIISKL